MESPDIDPKIINSLLIKVMPAVIQNYLAKGLLDRDKLNDREYIYKVMQENPEVIDEMGIVHLMHDNFIKSAQDAISANRPEVAVVLIATAIEQITNAFYRQVLQEKGTLTDDEITELIRASNTNAKYGWLLTLVAEYEIYDDFRKDLISLMEIRNQIVHFKAISVPAIVNEVPIRKRIQDFGLEKIMQLPDDLSEILDDALQNVLKEMPDYELVMKATKLFED